MMAWIRSETNNRSRSSVERRRRVTRLGSKTGGATFLLALCVAGLTVCVSPASAARLPLMEEVYRPNAGDAGVVDPGMPPTDQHQALLEYLEDPFQPNMYTQEQLMQLALRLHDHPELLAQLMALKPEARRFSLMEEVIARLPAAAGAMDATPAPPQPKRGNYMALCHFKICNMGRKRRQEMQ